MIETMNPLQEVINKLFDVNTYYMFSTVLCIYAVLKYLIKKPSKAVAIGISLLVGTILFGVFYKVTQSSIEQLIYTFFVSTVLYNWIIKGIMSRLGDTYSNNKGVI